MPQPVFGQVHVSAALTMISVAYLQDESHYIADKIFPPVPVEHQADVYYVFNKDDFYRDEAQQRADATESAGGGFNLTTQTYSAAVWAWHKDVGEQVRRNQDPAVDLDATTTELVTQRLLIRKERLFASNFMKTGVWGTDITGVASSPSGTQTIYWSDDANGDPFSDVATAQTTILQNTGYEANVLAISWPVYQALRKHPLVIDRIKYTSPAFAGKITPQLLAAAFDIEEVYVAKAVYNSAAEGATGSYSFIQGKNALLAHRARSPSLMTPTAGYTFPWSGFTGLNNMGIRVATIPMPWLGLGTVRIEGEMAFDMQVVASSMGYYFSGVVQ